jgi:hypothetical protein
MDPPSALDDGAAPGMRIFLDFVRGTLDSPQISLHMGSGPNTAGKDCTSLAKTKENLPVYLVNGYFGMS